VVRTSSRDNIAGGVSVAAYLAWMATCPTAAPISVIAGPRRPRAVRLSRIRWAHFCVDRGEFEDTVDSGQRVCAPVWLPSGKFR
jgi:hypothetical protein